MHGFGMLKYTDKLKSLTESIQEADLIEIKNTPEQDARLENVIIPIMESEDSWKDLVKKAEPKAIVESGGVIKNKPEDGSSGNKKEDEEKEPLFEKKLGMGSLGMGKKGGLNVSPELNKGLGGGMALEENFGSNVVDESPQKEAKNRTKDSMVVRKAKEMFDEMYGSSFGKQTKFDFDSTKECGTKISNEPINRIPRGW
jgi:hypothetical protein